MDELTPICQMKDLPLGGYTTCRRESLEPSHLHTQARVQPRNTYNHTYITQHKQSHTKSRHINLHSVHARPCRIYELSGPINKQQITTHGNAPTGSGSYLRPTTHIQHTHSQHLNTSTQTSTNHKSTHCNRMG